MNLKSMDADAYYQAGNVCLSQGNLNLAIENYRQAVSIKSDFADAYCNLGVALKEQGELESAIESYRCAIAIAPDDAEIYSNLGEVLLKQRRFDEAIENYHHALALNSNVADTYNNLAIALIKQDRLEEAIESCQQALLIDPNYAEVHFNLGILFWAQDKLTQAVDHYKKALELKPDYIDAHNDLGSLLLSLGEFKEGWQHYAARYDPRLKTRTVFVPNFNFPQWSGESIVGKSLLIWCEQGLGDDIQFCRYVSVLKSLGVRHVNWLCRKPLKDLLKTVEAIDSVLTQEDATLITPHDYWTFALSIPFFCKTTLDNIPATVPYLHANSESVNFIAATLKSITEFKVGICWKGNPAHENDANRSPGIAIFKSLFAMPQVKFFTLQPDTREEFIHAAGKGAVDRGYEIDQNSFEEAAALTMNLDLIIACDTSICHLAGALGKPVWIVLPFIADWRWLIDREDSPWYPTARLFRQTTAGDWNGVFQRVEKCLKELIVNREIIT